MSDVIIYPNGKSGGNPNPHMEFEGISSADKIQLSVNGSGNIQVSSTTKSNIATIGAELLVDGAKVTGGIYGLYVGGIEMINEVGEWVGPAEGISGFTGAQGAQGASGTTGSQGSIGAQGAQGSQGAKGAIGNVGAQGSQGSIGPQGAQGATGGQGQLIGSSI